VSLAVRRFRILYVCSANLCRSVLAERLTHFAITAQPGGHPGRFQIASAGVRATTGAVAHPCTTAALVELGADVHGFLSRRLTPALVRDSDLVLTATAEHRDRAVALLPEAARRTFTIREFARIAAHLPSEPPRPAGSDVVDHARSVVDDVATLRGQVDYVEPSSDDIADPPRVPAAFRSCAREIAHHIEVCIRALCPSDATSG
jgi:protein-tyrosine phosphatase